MMRKSALIKSMININVLPPDEKPKLPETLED
jgi:hypothetical protein